MFFLISHGGLSNLPWVTNVSKATIIRSFDQCGITTQNMANYGTQLRHFVRSYELVDNVDLADEANHEMFGHGDGDSWEPEVEDLEVLDSNENENS